MSNKYKKGFSEIVIIFVAVSIFAILFFAFRFLGGRVGPKYPTNNYRQNVTEESPNYAKGQIIVSFDEDTTIKEAEEVLAKYNLSSDRIGDSPLEFQPVAVFGLGGKDFDTVRNFLKSYDEVNETSSIRSRPDYISVTFKQDVKKSRASEIASLLGLSIDNIHRSSWIVVEVPVGEEQKYIELLTSDPKVVSANLNYLMHTM